MFVPTGYDSDVEREKKMDYGSKIYVNPIRERAGVRPHLQNTQELARSAGAPLYSVVDPPDYVSIQCDSVVVLLGCVSVTEEGP